MFEEEEEGGWGRKCCALYGTMVRTLKHFLQKYAIPKLKHLMNDSSSYELLPWNSTRLSRQDARR